MRIRVWLAFFGLFLLFFGGRAHAAIACHVDYTISSQWNTGFTGQVLIQNQGDALSGWQVTWDMPDQQRITNLWRGSFSQTGDAITVNSQSWNGSVNSNAAFNFGFNASYSGANNIPTNIKVNGVLCAGQSVPDDTPPEISCNVEYHIRNQWNTGFTTDVTVNNTGDDLSGWEVTWNMPNSQTISHLWNGSYTQSGSQIKVTNVGWNRDIANGKQIVFGFNASHTGINPAPIDLALNGVRCDGQADEIILPPNAPDTLILNLIDNMSAQLNWQDESDNETGFIIQRRIDAGQWQNLATVDSDVTTYADDTLQIGIQYDYQVQASNSTGDSAFSNIVSGKRQDRLDIRPPMLANNCASCHGTDGKASGVGIPVISGLDRDYFIRTMEAYKTGERAGSGAMTRVAKGYTSEHIELLADYFSALPFVAAEQEVDLTLARRGRDIHQNRCIFCHSSQGEDDSLTGTRLAGQALTYLYATLEDYSAGHSSNIPNGMAAQLSGTKMTFGADALEALAHYYAASPDVNDLGSDDDGSGDNGTDGNDDSGDSGGDGSGNDGSGDDSDDSGNGDDSGDSGGDGSGDGDNGGDDSDSGGDNTATAPTAPANPVTTVIENASVQISWVDNSDNETGFRLQRKLVADSDWSDLVEIPAGSDSYLDNSVQADNDYAYRLVAFNDAGDSEEATVLASLLSSRHYGALLYQQQGCASCHGSDGSGGFINVPLNQYTADQVSSLIHSTETTMPPANPAACNGNCAGSIAEYILATFAGSGEDNGNLACASEPPPAERGLRLLTRQEYQHTVNDLLGLSVNIIHELPEENRVEGFDNNSANNLITSLRLEGFLNQADNLAAQAVSQNWSGIVSCNTEDETCARQFITEFGQRAYRRPLQPAEVDALYSRFTATGFAEGVENTVMAMLVSPYFLYRSELGELQADSTYQLTQYEIATALAYLFTGSMPDATLLQAADNGALQTPAQRIAQASRLLNDPRSRNQIGNFVGQWLLGASPYALPDKDLNVYPGYTDEVREALSQELISFFNHVTFDSTQTFRELFTANYVIANKKLTAFYNLSDPVGNGYEIIPVNDGTRTGLLTLGAVLAQYANSAESHPFKRGAFFFERVLCHELPAPENAGIVQPPTPDPDLTTRERFTFHSESDTDCFSCHQYLDGPGFSFESYDGAGQFRQYENGNLVDTSGILRGLETFTPDEQVQFTDLLQISQLVSESNTAAQCLAKQYYRYSTGRLETSADQCALDSFITDYADNDYNLQTMLLGIVNSPAFTLRRAGQ
ncbi:MAG: Cellulose-binding domain protein [uncultured Thiotrichaceae bacterium]|uniref:Cellulose-binding domain protein n=1 Tax=uncultured Thiotrichaceae bacterium TaxID=298394 RepID=A0A6S6TAR6_9GAMM|nr:MAG: Cellulose-binding domain protein [uncultured Thiotrichaceae bacterium]